MTRMTTDDIGNDYFLMPTKILFYINQRIVEYGCYLKRDIRTIYRILPEKKRYSMGSNILGA